MSDLILKLGKKQSKVYKIKKSTCITSGVDGKFFGGGREIRTPVSLSDKRISSAPRYNHFDMPP